MRKSAEKPICGILAVMLTAAGCGNGTEVIANTFLQYTADHARVVESSAVSETFPVSEETAGTEDDSFAAPAPNAYEEETAVPIAKDFVPDGEAQFLDGLLWIAEKAESVEALEKEIGDFDTERRVSEIRVYKNAEDRGNGIAMTEGGIKTGMIIYVTYDGGESWFESRRSGASDWLWLESCTE